MSGGRATAGAPASSYWALFVLFLANIFNVGDRIIFGVVVQPIKLELALSDTQLSLASGLFFVLFNLVGGLFIARMVDRGNRIRILAAGVAAWSLATAATGLAQDFFSLSLARIVVGIGEATAFPAAMSLIPDLFRLEARGKAVAIFQSSSFIGIVGGTILAGILGAALGWRSMFFACGLAGLAVAMLLLISVPEPERESRTGESTMARGSYWTDLWEGCIRVLRLPGYLALLLAFGISGMMVFVLGAWGPAFLLRSHGVPLAEVGVVIGPAVGGGGIAGTLFSGFLADRLVRWRGRAEDMLKIPLVTIPLSLPFMATFIYAESLAVTMGAAAIMNFLLSAAIPSTMNYAVNRTAAGDRGLTSTILLAANGLIGGALGPLIVGALSDWFAPVQGDDALRYALAALLVTPLIGSIFFFAAYRQASRAAGKLDVRIIDQAHGGFQSPSGQSEIRSV